MKVKDLIDCINELPQNVNLNDILEYDVIFRDYKKIDQYDILADQPFFGLYIDDENKEFCFMSDEAMTFVETRDVVEEPI